jgi:hypothetical protein
MVAKAKPKPDLYLELAGMSDRKACTMTVDTQAKFSSDIIYTVPQVCLHMHDPREPYLNAVKRILC